MKKNIRELTQNHRPTYMMYDRKKDVILVTRKVIDQNGNINTITEKVVDNSSEKLGDIPPYSCDIEFMSLVGTLNDGHPVHIGYLDNQKLSDRQIKDNIVSIIKQNKQINNNQNE